MSSRPWMPFYVNDFLTDTLDLDVGEVGVYFVMLLLCWRRDDAALPNDMAWLKRSLKSCFRDFHGHTFNRIVPNLLERYFELGGDNKWRNKRLVLERQKADKLSAKQSQTANKRWSNYRENKELANASAMPSQSQSHKIVEFREVGKKRDWPYHGCVSKRRGTIWLKAGTPDFEAYAADFRHKHRTEPAVVDGGFWFSILGETG